MKKVICLLMALSIVLCLCACDEMAESVPIDTATDSDIRFWTDEETGVQYVIYDNYEGYGGMGGITPRLNADGTLYHPTEKGGAE